MSKSSLINRLGDEFMAAKKEVKSKIDPNSASRILRTVPIPEAFLFFTGIGQYNGEFAHCLADFSAKLKKIPLKSIEFHFKRGDFERWIRETLSDEHLANGISKIDRSTQGEELRTTIQRIVKNRLDQLKAATMPKT
jgi:hypothetical protein